ncbi:unnamed protein product [Schistosoma curassoni]|uniref:Uncharacterized protein n=1 Tax=Schistosoma curassoni TaxID=6186 RepID=A0A183K921_9TREM|nr:unnamed protein product [Schistosoma curassoni]
MEQMDVHSISEALEDYLEWFEIWSVTKNDAKGDKIVAHFLTFIGKEAYSLLKTLAYPEKPISLPYATLKQLLLNYDARTACINCEALNELDIQSMKISNTLLSRHNEIQSQINQTCARLSVIPILVSYYNSNTYNYYTTATEKAVRQETVKKPISHNEETGSEI